MIQHVNRDELIGKPTFWKVSDLGVVQQPHPYPQDLVDTILRKALLIKQQASEKKHLNLRMIRGAHTLIPEVDELRNWPGRLNRLSDAADSELEHYPVSVIGTTITFMGAEECDGTVDWHADGVPVTEIVPHLVKDTDGGELQVFRGDHEIGLSQLAEGLQLAESDTLRFPHQMGCSTLAQLLRVLHRTAPMRRGTRVSLNLNLRSRTRPWIDDNSMCYLAADNPDFAWQDEYLQDVRQRQLPAYVAGV